MRAVQHDHGTYPVLLWADEHGYDVKPLDPWLWSVDGKLQSFLVSDRVGFFSSRWTPHREPRGYISTDFGGYEGVDCTDEDAGEGDKDTTTSDDERRTDGCGAVRCGVHGDGG